MKKILSVAFAACLAIGALYSSAPATGSIAQPHVVSEDPANFTPNIIDGGGVDKTSVDALAQLGNTLYAGGEFRLVQKGGTTFNRTNLVSFDATDGTVTPNFAPTFDGKVFALLATGTSLYVGGYFHQANGVARRGLVKLNATTGAVDTAFDAHLNGAVQEIRLVNGRLLVGGKFSQKLLALNPATGANTNYINISITGTVASNAGATDVYRFAVNPQGTRLVAIGNFTTVGGQDRRRAFMLDLGASATLSQWYYAPLRNNCRASSLPAYMRDVDFSPDGSYFVVDTTGFVPFAGGVGRDLCDAAARFETNVLNPTRPTWINYSGGDTFHSILATGAAVYVQGHFRALDNPNGTNGPAPGSSPRQGIGAINPTTGLALPWNPGKTRGVGGKDFLATSAGLWVASDGRMFNGEVRDNIAFCPL
jgi:hypothetical protein